MENENYIDTERQIHDWTIVESIDRKERLLKAMNARLNTPIEQLKQDRALTSLLLQLTREESSTLKGLEEDVGIFLCENMDADEEIKKAGYRVTGKNSQYNRAKAKQYIDTYWQNYNPAYPTFHGGGGDCANFVSQVLRAGGMQFVDDGNPNHYAWASNWYCKPGATNRDGDRRITLSWKVAAAFRRHWEKRVARLLKINYADAINNMEDLAKQVYVGDPVQFCYANGIAYHTLVVTGYSWDKAGGFNDIVLASHTIDSNKRSLYHTMLKYPKDYQLRVYVIKEGS